MSYVINSNSDLYKLDKKHTLFPHQLALINKFLSIEKHLKIKYENGNSIFSKLWQYCDPPGTGKTITMLGLIAFSPKLLSKGKMMCFDDTCYLKIEKFTNGACSTLVVCNENQMKKWIKAIEQFENIVTGTKLKYTILSDDTVPSQYDIVFYNASVAKQYTWNRLILYSNGGWINLPKSRIIWELDSGLSYDCSIRTDPNFLPKLSGRRDIFYYINYDSHVIPPRILELYDNAKYITVATNLNMTVLVDKPDIKDDNCSICYGNFRIPTVLPCSHMFCFICIFNWIKTGRSEYLCPFCKQAFKCEDMIVYNNEFLNLRRPYIKNNIKEALQEIFKNHEYKKYLICCENEVERAMFIPFLDMMKFEYIMLTSEQASFKSNIKVIVTTHKYILNSDLNFITDIIMLNHEALIQNTIIDRVIRLNNKNIVTIHYVLIKKNTERTIIDMRNIFGMFFDSFQNRDENGNVFGNGTIFIDDE